MVGNLLLRGMITGIVAGILTFGFLKVAGEPAIDRAIAFESAMDAAKDKAKADEAVAKELPMPMEEAEPELVSRPIQAGIGLFTGVLIYNTAFGGLFALVFALAYGRIGALGPRGSAALLAASGIVAIYIVPNLKYPANPPSVGNPDTIGMRTGLYFVMILVSLAAMIAAWKLRGALVGRYGGWNAALTCSAAYFVAMGIVAFALPAINEVPTGFPADLLWQFRLSSIGAQLIMWSTIGLGFGALTEAAATRGGRLQLWGSAS